MKILCRCFLRIGIFFVLLTMHVKSLQAEVVHQVRFCKGIICYQLDHKSLSIGLQLELNQRMKEGSLNAVPISYSNLKELDKSIAKLPPEKFSKKL